MTDRRTRVAALLAAALLGTGCMGGNGEPAAVAAGDLPKLVLQPADLGPSWSQFDEGAQVRTDAPPGERADERRFGRLGGWKARYQRRGTAATAGPLVVESRADLFAEVDGARRELEALERQIEDGELLGRDAESLDDPDLGDEATGATLKQGGGDAAIRYYLVAWRHGAVTASVTINGFDRRTSLADAVSIARKQQARIAAASR